MTIPHVCLRCGKPTSHGAKYCYDPECQEAKRKARLARSSDRDYRTGRRTPKSDRLCQHCQTVFKGRRNQKFCLQTPECKAAQQRDHSHMVMLAHKNRYGKKKVVEPKPAPGRVRICLHCGKKIHGPNLFYHPKCHTTVSKGVAFGFDGFCPDTTSFTLYSLFPGTRSGEYRRRAAV